jgi:hypothetical protein
VRQLQLLCSTKRTVASSRPVTATDRSGGLGQGSPKATGVALGWIKLEGAVVTLYDRGQLTRALHQMAELEMHVGVHGSEGDRATIDLLGGDEIAGFLEAIAVLYPDREITGFGIQVLQVEFSGLVPVSDVARSIDSRSRVV